MVKPDEYLQYYIYIYGYCILYCIYPFFAVAAVHRYRRSYLMSGWPGCTILIIQPHFSKIDYSFPLCERVCVCVCSNLNDAHIMQRPF